MTAAQREPVRHALAPWARRLWWLPAAAAGLGSLAVGLRWGGGVSVSRITGLPTAGELTAWGLPLATLVSDLIGAVTAGLCLTAAFFLPGDGRVVGAAAYRLLRRASWTAALWAVAGVGRIALSVSDLLGQPVSTITPTIMLSFVTVVAQGQALAVQVSLAVVAALVCRATIYRRGAAITALLALVALLPPAFTGHAAGAGNHQLAVTSLALHVLAAALWLGGLIAVLAVKPRTLIPDVAARFSRLAAGCVAAVAVSGVANAIVRLGSWGAVWHSGYGWLVLGKVAALLTTVGAVHRGRTLPRLRAGAAGAFARLAVAEVSLFAATFGLAVALSRTPTPAPTNPVEYDPFADLVGFSMPPPISAARLLAPALPDLAVLAAAVVGVAAYLVGVWRLRRTGHHWPLTRTTAWVGGVILLAAMTNLGIARYAYLLFSVHMAQHMILSMIVPGLLVAGAPVTLALRTLRNPTDVRVRGARQWLLLVLHSAPARLITHPVVALLIYASGLYVLYFSPLLSFLMRSHLGHLAMIVHFVASGYLLVFVLVGTDPGRRRWPQPLLILVLFAAMAFHTFFGVALMQSQQPIAADWYGVVHPPWANSLADDQRLGAGIAWAFGEIPAALILLLIVRQWIAADEREQRRIDRAADRANADGAEDDLARYNAFLRRVNANQ